MILSLVLGIMVFLMVAAGLAYWYLPRAEIVLFVEPKVLEKDFDLGNLDLALKKLYEQDANCDHDIMLEVQLFRMGTRIVSGFLSKLESSSELNGDHQVGMFVIGIFKLRLKSSLINTT